MAVARLGSVGSSDSVNALAHTIGAGNDRCLMVAVTQEVASPVQMAVGYGGQSMSAVVGIGVGDSTDQRVDIYYLNDAGIAAASDNQIDITSPPSTFSILAQAYQGAMQTTPTIIDSEAVTGDSDPLTNIQIAAAADEAVFGVAGSGNTSTGVTWAGTNPLTNLVNIEINATAHGTIADRLVTGTETVNHNLTFTTAPNRVAGAACLIEASAAGITGVTPSEFDFDNTDVDIEGNNFEASQGSGQVWISDASTLAGSVNEEEIDGAINTWSDTVVNLDFSGLSQTEIDNLHSLGPGASRWIILTNNSSDEFSFQITLHRPNAIEMVLSAEFAPSVTTARLTGMSGTFGGGRIEEALNPSTTDTDVANDGNREDVWNIQLTPAAREEIYDFRTLYNGVVATTITQTPQVTGSAAIVDMAAALDIITTVAADLDAQGGLDAALALALTTAAALTAEGKLDAALVILSSVAADIKGAGELVAPLSILLTVAADLRAIGDIEASIAIALNVAAQLSAEGSLAAALSIVTTVAADLSAEGRLEAANSILLSVVADLGAAGVLDASINLAVTVAAELNAAGELAAANSILVTVTAAIAEGAPDDMAASLNLVLTVAATMSAEGTLDAGVALALTVAADLSAEGKVEAALALIVAVAADLEAAGELTAALLLQLSVAADLKATGGLSAVLVTLLTVAAALSAEGNLAAAVSIVTTVAADLQAASAVDMQAVLPIILSVGADLSALGNLAAAPSMVMSVAADFEAAGRLEAATNLLVTLAGDLRAAGVLRGALNINVAMAAELTAEGELRAGLLTTVSVAALLADAGGAPAAPTGFRNVWTSL